MRAAGLGVLLLAAAVAAPAVAAPSAPAGAPASVADAADRWLDAAAEPAGAVLGDDWERDDWDWVDRGVHVGDGSGTKSPLKAVVASALLPGLGERYVGRTGRAKAFHSVEGAVWATFIGYRIQGNLRRDRYEEFAVTQADAASDGDSNYYEHIGLWLSLEEWQDIVRRDARYRFPDDPEAQAEFFEANKRYDAGDAWAWPDDETRIRYRQLRSRSERSYRNGRLALGAAIVNRLASMMDALAVARAHNRKLREEARLELRVVPRETAEGLVVGPVLSARY